MLEFHVTDGAILHLCWAHRVFNEIAHKRYLLPIQELIYKRLSDYFSGFIAKSKNNDLPVSNDKLNDSGKKCRESTYVLLNISSFIKYNQQVKVHVQIIYVHICVYISLLACTCNCVDLL